MAAEQVTVTIAEPYRDRFAEIVGRCQEAGLEVGQRLGTIGVVTGSVESDRLAELRQVDGVADVERARTVTIAPPESDVQ